MPGNAFRRGAIWDGEGVNFALFSEHAERVELCIFDASGKRELQLIMDSLRYWVQEMHIDGFRFDLASSLARELHEGIDSAPSSIR